MASADREIQGRITQQDDMYKVNTHIVQAAMGGDNPPISEAELEAKGPQVAAAWQAMQVENPLAAAGVERMFDANAHGAALVYGTGFHDYLDRALSPAGDPNRITNSAQLYPFVGKGNDAPLTNTGINALNDLLAARGGSSGEAFAQQTRTFIDGMHGNLTFSNKGTGIVDEKGEARFSKFMAVALPALVKAQKAGTLGDVLNPQSKDYLGNAAQPFMRSPAETIKDKLEYDNPDKGIAHPLLRGPAFTPDTLRTALGGLENDRQRNEFLTDAVRAGRLTKQTMLAYERGNQPGVAPGGFPAAPTPRVNVPGQ